MLSLHRLARFAPVVCALGFAVAGAAALAQGAEGYPAKPIRLIVPYSPGSGMDLTARLLAEKLPATLGGPAALVDNRPGASGTIGTAAVARAAPDGLTLMVSPTTHVITSAVRKVEYDPIGDFTPVVALGRGSFVVAVASTSPAHTLDELLRLLKARKGDASYSSAGIASTVHLFTETLLQATGTQARHIPGKGITGALMDVMQAHVDFTVAPVELALQQAKAGKIRMLAQTTATRSKHVPDVPTVAELGYPGFEATFWLGVYAPARTPPAIVAKLNRSINELLARPETQQFLDRLGMEPMGGSAEQFLSLNKADLARYTAVAKAAHISAD